MKTEIDLNRELQEIYTEVQRRNLSSKSADPKNRKRYEVLRKKAEFIKPLLYYLQMCGIDGVIRMKERNKHAAEVFRERHRQARNRCEFKLADEMLSKALEAERQIKALDYILEPEN